MEKIKIECGLIAYKTTFSEILSIGGLGICDACGQSHHEGGYLVPVLNWWMCEECFNDWKSRATYYPEDAPYEAKRAEYYEAMIPLTDRPVKTIRNLTILEVSLVSDCPDPACRIHIKKGDPK